ncbi:MAG: polysaccharide deacetylase family protein [Candidatus Poribacteria bacterium]|nr:polysaccharide deacetylase family protein [Candidatus Poribacteria bacterium]
MRFIAAQGYTAITPDSLIHFISSHSALPCNPILITFDDGYESFYNFAYPILKKYGLTATVFMIAAYIGRLNEWDVQRSLKRPKHLSESQIKSLVQNGIGFGSHGLHHRFLTHCSRVEANAELEESKYRLEHIIGRPVRSFAYPYGSVNAETLDLVKSAGYRIAFSLDPVRELSLEAMYRFPRMGIYRCDTFRSFQGKLGLLGRRRFKFECLKNRLINRFAYLNVLRYA